MTLDEALHIAKTDRNHGFTSKELYSEDTFKAMCVNNNSYPELTEGNVYSITMAGYIMECNPLCKGIGDKGKKFHCHAHRFVKIEKENNNNDPT